MPAGVRWEYGVLHVQLMPKSRVPVEFTESTAYQRDMEQPAGVHAVLRGADLVTEMVALCFLFLPGGSLSALACRCCSPGSVITGCGCVFDTNSGHAWPSEGSCVSAG